MTERFRVVWRVYPHLDLIQMSGILTGMVDLARRGIISFRTEFTDAVAAIPSPIMEMVVTDTASGIERAVVFDFYDGEGSITPSSLAFSEVYFKRQFGPETLAAAPPDSRAKIRPLGLTIAGFSRAAWRVVAASIYASLRTRKARQARAVTGSPLIFALRDLRLWAGSTPTESVMLRDSDVKEPHIVFQPRLWNTVAGSGDHFDEANKDRIATVRAMKKAFPNERNIGLVHSPFAAEHAPDLMLDRNVTTAEYHQQLRSSVLAVNCVGLSGSVGWKLAEYLAAGNAIVSQPIHKRLLAPLEANRHYLSYESPEECVLQCRRLLADAALAAQMRDINRAYYLHWTHPPAHALHLLTQAFE